MLLMAGRPIVKHIGRIWVQSALVAVLLAGIACGAPVTGNICRCTDYRTPDIEAWLCGTCTNSKAPAELSWRRGISCPPATAADAEPACYLASRFADLVAAQNITGLTDAIRIGSEDRVIDVTLEAMKVMCSTWSLDSPPPKWHPPQIKRYAG
jgi:hypothetical protein